jgi:hypothetical protein
VTLVVVFPEGFLEEPDRPSALYMNSSTGTSDVASAEIEGGRGRYVPLRGRRRCSHTLICAGGDRLRPVAIAQFMTMPRIGERLTPLGIKLN